MKYFLLISSFLMFFAPASQAQEVTAQPICFNIRNTAPYKVYGQVATDYYTTPDGTKARHTGTFRLEAKGTLHEKEGYPLDITEFCSSGPFYPGRKMELMIRTLVPIFTCKTSVEMGEIIIRGQKKEDGSYKTWAECY